MTSAWAVKVLSIYQADIPVISQADDLRDQAVREGFLQVLIKVSGDPQIGDNPVIHASLEKAAYYVQEYSYSSPTTASSEYTLQINYNPDDIIRLLKKANAAYWGENRPLILVWLVTTNQRGNTEIVNSDTPGDLYQIVKREGKKYGLPLIFPIMDVTDMDQITANDIVDVNLPVLREATKRYAPDALLIGKITENGAYTKSQWQLIFHRYVWHFTLADQRTDNIVASLMDQVRKLLAKNYVAQKNTATTVWVKLKVTNMVQKDDLKTLIQYLQELAPVQQVKLLQVEGDTAEIALLLHGSLNMFQQYALVNQHLVRNDQASTENEMVYGWVP